ncbi:MAG: CinA family nicotinamide mononucleotide deamidase-related protein, partial [Actinobacteria bacterium]|nr:CinA family nicotinamide mononucleotide deamidase-related protein [Actinomycetota bacterium]
MPPRWVAPLAERGWWFRASRRRGPGRLVGGVSGRSLRSRSLGRCARWVRLVVPGVSSAGSRDARYAPAMRCDVLAIGTELLLGQIVDTNSSWLGEQLAEAGIDTYDHRKIGDNLTRMVDALSDMLVESDAVIVCGGLGPTPDDVTREMIAEVMGVGLERREDLIETIRGMFGSRGRDMPENNLRQADIPVGAEPIDNPIGTAPGIMAAFVLPDGRPRVVYAVPGVPYEMQQMVRDHVLPDLLARSGEQSVIRSRSLKTWGTSESGLAEMIAHRVDAQSNPTIAFLARGIEGLYVRMTAKAATEAEAQALLDAEDAELRSVLGELVFGIDDETMESTVLRMCRERGWTLGVAESLTGGLIGARLANVPGASEVFRGSVASYATDVK